MWFLRSRQNRRNTISTFIKETIVGSIFFQKWKDCWFEGLNGRICSKISIPHLWWWVILISTFPFRKGWPMQKKMDYFHLDLWESQRSIYFSATRSRTLIGHVERMELLYHTSVFVVEFFFYMVIFLVIY